MLGDLIGHWTVRSAPGSRGYSIAETPWTRVADRPRAVRRMPRPELQPAVRPGRALGCAGLRLRALDGIRSGLWLADQGQMPASDHRRVGRLRRRSRGADHARRSGRSRRGGQQHVPGRDRAERHSEPSGRCRRTTTCPPGQRSGPPAAANQLRLVPPLQVVLRSSSGQRPSAATVSRHASAQAASSIPTLDSPFPVHAAQMSIDSTSILRNRSSGSGTSA